MTTLTPGYGLIYQTGTDAPCDSADVWCEFANTLNTVSGGLKDILDRVDPAVPAAIVGLTNSTIDVGTAGAVIPFDTVLVDTDRMVDFDFSTRVVFPRRPGIYAVTASAVALSLGPGAHAPIFTSIITSFSGFPSPSGTGGSQTSRIAEDVIGSLAPGNPYYLHIATVANVTADTINLSATNLGGFAMYVIAGNDSYRISAMRMGVHYLRDAA